MIHKSETCLRLNIIKLVMNIEDNEIFYYRSTWIPSLEKQSIEMRGFRKWIKGNESRWTVWFGSIPLRANEFGILDSSKQHICRMPQMSQLTSKSTLARLLSAIPDRRYVQMAPATYVMGHPRDRNQFSKDSKDLDADVIWICKPKSSANGIGIFLTKSISEVMRRSMVVQRYLTNTALISGFKFDLRLYVVARRGFPLECAVCPLGIVRFASRRYDPKLVMDLNRHLTNFSVNKKNVDKRERVRLKWKLSELWEHMAKKGVDVDMVWERIKNVCTLTMWSASARYVRENQDGPLSEDLTNQGGCSQLFGFDIMLESDTFQPRLIEVNLRPSLNSETDVDKVVKMPMLQGFMTYSGLPDLRTDIEKASDVDMQALWPRNHEDRKLNKIMQNTLHPTSEQVNKWSTLIADRYPTTFE